MGRQRPTRHPGSLLPWIRESGFRALPAQSAALPEVQTMGWQAPAFVEIRMDAELTAYCDDLAD
jgi:hypothetical protein